MTPSTAEIRPEGSGMHPHMEAGTSSNTTVASKQPPPTSERDHDPLVRLSSSSSSSSSSCASFDPFQLDGHAIADGSDSHLRPETNSTSSFRFNHEDASPSPIFMPEPWSNEPADPLLELNGSHHSLHSSSSSSNGSITQSPPVQVMERSGDLESGSSPAPYRIPSSVFARTKSTAPQEWSVTSNESLFSIHMGNMSFNKDLYWMCKSGELMPPPLMDCTSNQPLPPLIDHSSNQPPAAPPPLVDHYSSNPPSPKPASNSIDIFKQNMALDDGLQANPEAVETMKSVLRENAEADHEKEALSRSEGASCHSNTASPSHRSSNSEASTKSFAFPILGSDGGKSGSSKVAGGSMRQHSNSVRHNHEPHSPKPQNQNKQQANKAAAPVDRGQTRWFSCFSCCSFCSS